MRTEELTFNGEDGKEIFYYKWSDEKIKNSRGVVQIAHGMAEHAGRYSRFASSLVKAGYKVYANDHRGHGRTAGKIEEMGFFAEKNGWMKVVADMHKLTLVIKKEQLDKPVFLLGHSMGSLLSRSYISRFGDEIRGVILSGTAGNPGVMGKVGKLLARWEVLRKGKKGRSPLMNRLSFGSFNSSFQPVRTDLDWLSRDRKEVDKYIKDPYCGRIFTAGFFQDLMYGMEEVNDQKCVKKIPRKLPVYFLSGEKDPVGNNTKGVRQVYQRFKNAGIIDVTCKFYPDARHEILNELNREEVVRDIIVWLEKYC